MYSKSPRCQVLPLAGNQTVFVVDGRERLRWHAAEDAPRPFFFPLIGPAGFPLTRMGHPGAPNHDHHRSIWFAHHKVLGIDFWSDQTDAVIRQSQWLAYTDGEESAMMAVQLKWYDGHDPQPLLNQELIVSVAPEKGAGLRLELQTSLTSVAESLELGQTHFGLLAVRVAKSISTIFGDGIITGEDGRQGEQTLFGKASRWIDYSGSVDEGVVEGITYFDHADNAGYPGKWHVRDDGWMGLSICRDGPVMLSRESPTTFRYLLHAHPGSVDQKEAARVAGQFHATPPFKVIPSTLPHHQFEIGRDA